MVGRSLLSTVLSLHASPGALADAYIASNILRLANLWLAGCAGALALLGWFGILNPMLLLVGVFVLGVGFAINAPAWVSLVPQIVTDQELPSASTLSGVQLGPEPDLLKLRSFNFKCPSLCPEN